MFTTFMAKLLLSADEEFPSVSRDTILTCALPVEILGTTQEYSYSQRGLELRAEGVWHGQTCP